MHDRSNDTLAHGGNGPVLLDSSVDRGGGCVAKAAALVQGAIHHGTVRRCEEEEAAGVHAKASPEEGIESRLAMRKTTHWEAKRMHNQMRFSHLQRVAHTAARLSVTPARHRGGAALPVAVR